jgi:hypothetical protein
MAVTHTPDTIGPVTNAMIDRLAWDMIEMATDRAHQIMGLANERAQAILRPEPTTRSAEGANTSEGAAPPARVLSLPLVPSAPALHPAASRPANGTHAATAPKQPRTVTAPQTSAAAAGGAPDGNRGVVKASVLAHLQAQPGVSMTVTTVAKAVGKAAGSVGAALESLAKSGDIARTGDAPKTYAWREQA